MSLMLIVIVTIVYNSYDASLSGISFGSFDIFYSHYRRAAKVQIKCFYTIYSILVLFSPDKQKHFPRNGDMTVVNKTHILIEEQNNIKSQLKS